MRHALVSGLAALAAAAALTAGLGLSATTRAASPAGPPVAPVRPVTDTYFGTPVVDNYRYLENLQDPAVQSWMHGQADYTRARLDALPGRAALLERIHVLLNTDTRRSGTVRRGKRYFYLVTAPGAQQPKLYCRDGLQGEEHLLLDTTTMGAGSGTHYALDFYEPSWDGHRLAYGLSTGGSEASTLHVMEVDTAKVQGEAITRTSNSIVNWLRDNQTFYYMRFNAPTPTTPASELEYNARAYLHRVGTNTDGEHDPVVFGRGVSKAVEVPEGQGAYVLTSADSSYAVAAANHNLDANPSTFYVAPLAAATGTDTKWQRFARVADGITQVALHGDTLYFLSLNGAPRFRLLATSLQHPDIAHARVVVPEGEGVITDFGIASDGLYYRVRQGSGAQLMRVAFAGQRPEAVPLPYEGNLFGPVTEATQPGAMYNIQGWVRPPQMYAYDPAKHASVNTGLLPASQIDVSKLVATEVQVTSYDGTRVPLSILHLQGVALDGRHPTIIDGYGAYGVVEEAGFSPQLIAWLERGGVFAVAHVRGGGELGEGWHLGGFMRSKPNTFLDFIACSEYLIEKGYTSKQLLAGTGTSAGGILIGGAFTTRPDLYRVILDNVGMSDTLRSETEPNGPPNVSEFGSVANEDGFHGLYAMSAYAHVRAGTPYPAVLFITGANDPRVASWHMMKMAARVQAASTSGLPALLRIDYDAGHGIGSNRSQREQLIADEWAFALWQMGDPAFQPPR
jgi:prolyl oligopeptidase